MLWLETGNPESAEEVWSTEFTHVTTSLRSILEEVQTGRCDAGSISLRLMDADNTLAGDDLIREVGFVVNCRVALRLVEALDAAVSIGLRPEAAQDVESICDEARRYFAVLPERFVIKVPPTAAGYVGAHFLASEGIPVEFDSIYSARQSLLAAAIARPRFVTMVVGRLNKLVSDNGLGDGRYFGEKAALASQLALWQWRDSAVGAVSQLIARSLHSPAQVLDLAGVDAFLLAPPLAREVHQALEKGKVRLHCSADRQFHPKLSPGVKPDQCGLNSLWEISDNMRRVIQRLSENADMLATPDLLAWSLREAGVRNLLHEWTPPEREHLRQGGREPGLGPWRGGIESGDIGLDDLMSAAALEAAESDQAALDDHIRSVMVV